jgi:hypothetical protein
MSFVGISEQRATFALYIINWMLFVTAMECLLRRTLWILIGNTRFLFKGLDHIWCDTTSTSPSKVYLPIGFNQQNISTSISLHTPNIFQIFHTISIARHQWPRLTTLCTTRYGINGWRVIRLPAHKKSGRIHIPRPPSSSPDNCRDIPNEKKAMTIPWRHTRLPESGRRGEMSA